MKNLRDFSLIVETARIHYLNLKTDIENASNRIEHIRLTALTQEAHNVYVSLVAFEVGLVYSHTSLTDDYVNKMLAADTFNGSSEETAATLDLPEFVSPFTPPPHMQ
jgi:hypothetical protein